MSAEHAADTAPAFDAPAETPAHQEAAEQGVKVFAGNLTFTTDEAGLRSFFAPVENDIIAVSIIQRFGRSAGYGFVTVKTLEAAEKAVAELDKKEVEGRAVIVEVARTNEDKDAARKERQAKRKVGRRGSKAVPGEVTEAEANGQAAPAARIDDADVNGDVPNGTGEPGAAKPKKRKAPKKRKPKTLADGTAAPNGTNGVEETTEKMGQLGISEGAHADGEEKPARKPRREPREPRERKPRREPGEAPLGEPSKSVLFIANLAFSVDEAALTEFFTDAGVNVKTARVVRRRWGTPRKSKGYGFVDVGDEEEQHKAIELTNGKTIADREISVKIAVDAKHIDEAVEKAEGTENPAHPTIGGTAAFPIVPVQTTE